MIKSIQETKEEVFNLVQEKYKVKIIDIMSTKRHKCLIKARFITYALLSRSGLSYSAIARIFGKDHTTIMHGVETAMSKWENELEDCKIDRINPLEIIENKNPYSTGQSKKWAWVYKLYNGKCAVCGFSSVVQVHHIKPRSIGGSDHISNLIVLCPNHHALHHLGLVDISGISTPNSQNPQD